MQITYKFQPQTPETKENDLKERIKKSLLDSKLIELNTENGKLQISKGLVGTAENDRNSVLSHIMEKHQLTYLYANNILNEMFPVSYDMMDLFKSHSELELQTPVQKLNIDEISDPWSNNYNPITPTNLSVSVTQDAVSQDASYSYNISEGPIFQAAYLCATNANETDQWSKAFANAFHSALTQTHPQKTAIWANNYANAFACALEANKTHQWAIDFANAYACAKDFRNSEHFIQNYKHHFDMSKLNDETLNIWTMDYANAFANAKHNKNLRDWVSPAKHNRNDRTNYRWANSFAICIASKKERPWTYQYADTYAEEANNRDKHQNWSNLYAGLVADGKQKSWAREYANTHIGKGKTLEYTSIFISARDKGYSVALADQFATEILAAKNEKKAETWINSLTEAYDHVCHPDKSIPWTINKSWVSDFAKAFAFRISTQKTEDCINYLTKGYEIAKIHKKSTIWANSFADVYEKAINDEKSEVWAKAYATCVANGKPTIWATSFANTYSQNLTTNRSRDQFWGASNIDENWAECYATYIADGNNESFATTFTDRHQLYMNRFKDDEDQAKKYAFSFLTVTHQGKNEDFAHHYAYNLAKQTQSLAKNDADHQASLDETNSEEKKNSKPKCNIM